MDTKKTVLIVDDDRFLLDMYSVKFREDGFEVAAGAGGEDGLKRLREGLKPDAVVLDIVMPGVDGFQFLETVKKEGLAPNAKLIVLSNQGQDEEIQRARDLGADDYIVKASAIPSEVLEQVKKTLG